MKFHSVVITASALYVFGLGIALVDQLGATGGIAGFIKDYQTLIAGSFALISLLYLSEQIRLQRKQNRDQVRIARQSEIDALDVASASCTYDEPIFYDEEGKTIGISQMGKPSDEEVEYVRARTVPNIARSLQFLARQVSDWNRRVGELDDDDFLPEGTAKKKSKLRMINQARDRLRQSIERRRESLLPRD